MLPIVAFCGMAQAGKDTAAAYFNLTERYVRLSLADELKRDIVKLGLATEEECFVTKPPHVRRLLQVYGTDICRKIHGDDYWLWRWADRALLDTAGLKAGITVGDVRFPNEAEWFLARGAVLIHVRPNKRSLALRASWGDTIHVSEEGYRTIPALYSDHPRFYEIENEGTIQDLFGLLSRMELLASWPFPPTPR